MSLIVPTITTNDPHIYREQIERVATFASRIHIDFADGVFTENRLVNPIQAWWPEAIAADLHLMFEDPVSQAETIISLQPSLVIFHAEAAGDLLGLVEHWRRFGLIIGVSLLQDTTPADAHALIEVVDHVLLFSGNLGHFGGEADMRLLKKIPEIKKINKTVEIGWDGGVSLDNAIQLKAGGVDVLNTGGAIQRAENPGRAFAHLQDSVR